MNQYEYKVDEYRLFEEAERALLRSCRTQLL
jgi:hypothetical protein